MSFISQFSQPAESSILLGTEAISQLPKQLKEYGKLRPILITDKETKAVVRAFKRQIKGKAWLRAEYLVSDTTPTATEILDIKQLFDEATCDSIIALGTPKAIRMARAFRQAVDTEQKPYLILIPTLPGWGEEITQTLWNTDNNQQHIPTPLESSLGLPETVIYDTTFLLAMSDLTLSITAMNSLLLAMDRLLLVGSPNSKGEKDPLMDFQLREGILKIHNNLLLALDCPKEALYRTQLLQGISLVQSGMRDGLMGGAEILGRTMESHSGIPIGLSLPFLFPQFLMQSTEPHGLTTLFETVPSLGHDDEESLQKRLYMHIEELRKTLYRKCGRHFPLTLKECLNDKDVPFITPQHFESIIESTQIGIDKDTTARILMASYWGYTVQL